MTDLQIRQMLQEMRNAPVPPESLARVRARVAERTSAPVWRWWRLPLWVPALAGAAACVALILWTGRPAPSTAVDAPVDPPAVAQRVPTPEPPVSPRVVQRSKTRLVAKPRESTLIRIETPDPDVVLLLIADGGAE